VLAASIIRAMNLMLEAASTSETLVNFYQTTWRYNPEDAIFKTFCCRVCCVSSSVRVRVRSNMSDRDIEFRKLGDV
jgi:hypothetical protein